MSTGSDASFENHSGDSRLISRVQEFGFDSARVVVNRFAEMFERFQTGVGVAELIPDFLLPRDSSPGERIVEESQLTLPDSEPGGRSSRRMWLHNPTSQASSSLRLWVPSLVAHDGHALHPSAVTFSPASLPTIEADSSVDILVTVCVPNDARVGRYHGHIMVEGLPDTSLPVCINVVTKER